MALNPDKQRIAQAEIDRITEGQRLPNFEDRSRLPYVSALMKEVMRWHSVVPLGKNFFIVLSTFIDTPWRIGETYKGA